MKHFRRFDLARTSVQQINFLALLREILANAQELEGFADKMIFMFVDLDETFFTRHGTITAFETQSPGFFNWENHQINGKKDTDYVCLFTKAELEIFQQLCNLVTVVFVTRRDNPDTCRTVQSFGIPVSVPICVVPRGETKADYIQTNFGDKTKGGRIIIMDDSVNEINDYLRHTRIGIRSEIYEVNW